MKKLLSLFAIAMLLFASCEKIEGIFSDAGDVAVRFTATLNGQLGTKAISDGLTVDQLIFGVFQKDASGNYFEVENLRQNNVAVSGGKASVNTSLIKGETYTFVFWAQKGNAGHYNTDDLTAIEVNYSVANDESRDAFTAVEKDVVVNGAIAKEIVLKRPFAQINFGTAQSDWNAVTAAGASFTESELWVSGVADVYDAFSQVASAESAPTIEIGLEKTAMPSQMLTVNGTEYKYLSMNYILIPETEDDADNAMVEVAMTVDGHKNPVKLSNVPVKENYRTNVVGNLLSGAADFNIIVDEEYAGEANYDMLQLILANGGSYKLTGDVAVSEALVAKADVIIDLNGYSIKPAAEGYVSGQVGALISANGQGVDLVIEDSSAVQSGVVDATGSQSYAVEAINGAALTIKGGNFIGEITAVQASDGATVNIYGGEFEATPYNNTYLVINVVQQVGVEDSEVNVYGGRFMNFNPASPKSDNPDFSYVMDGYVAMPVGNGYDVIPVPSIEAGVVEMSSAASLVWLQQMVSTGNDFEGVTVELAQDVDLSDAGSWIPVGTSDAPFAGTFDGKGHTISNLTITGTDYAAFIAYTGENAVVGNIVFENVNIDATTKYAAAVVCEAGDNTSIENVKVLSGSINGTAYSAAIVFYMNKGSISQCENGATISSAYTGGIAGWVTNSTIENVENNGSVTGSIGAAGISYHMSGSTIENAVNNGAITSTGNMPASGIVAVQGASSSYGYCYNYGDVKSTADNPNSSAAGILGQAASKTAALNYCANYGAITAEQSYAGGIAYSLYGTIKAGYCYNAGAVTGADGAGAIAPKAQYGVNDAASCCLNAGAIASSNGVVYQASNKNTECYYYQNNLLYNMNGVEVASDAILGILNGGGDNAFFQMDNGKIVVVE